MTEPPVVIDYVLELEGAEDIAPLQHVLSKDLPEQVAARTLAEVGIVQPVSLSLVITGDDAIQALNKQFRQQDKPTDVLSFPLLDQPLVSAPAEQLWMNFHEEGQSKQAGAESNVKANRQRFIIPDELETNLGDIVISWPTVERQAAQAGHEAIYELLYLLSHGVLHLVGYDDQTEEGYTAMVRLQESVMESIHRSD
jgi:probable rRNA maturation factor